MLNTPRSKVQLLTIQTPNEHWPKCPTLSILFSHGLCSFTSSRAQSSQVLILFAGPLRDVIAYFLLPQEPSASMTSMGMRVGTFIRGTHNAVVLTLRG